MIVGTAFVYDIYFKKIPNYLLIMGYAGMVPLIFSVGGKSAAAEAFLGVFAVGVPLFIVYLVGGMGAGDVKLMGLMGGFLGVRDGLIYTVLVLFIGAFVGVVRLLADMAVALPKVGRTCGRQESEMQESGAHKNGAQESRARISRRRTGIRFSIPILIGYLMLLISKGGVL